MLEMERDGAAGCQHSPSLGGRPGSPHHSRCALVVPLFTPKLVDFVSSRVHHFEFNPLWYFVFDQTWVNSCNWSGTSRRRGQAIRIRAIRARLVNNPLRAPYSLAHDSTASLTKTVGENR